MNPSHVPDNPYLLLTPGPLSTSKGVRAALLRDWCTWDDDYKAITEEVRADLVRLATPAPGYTCVLMQGSGTFSVEATIGSAVPPDGGLLVVTNGAYGARMVQIARRLGMDTTVLEGQETNAPDLARLERMLEETPSITHVAMVHCETTTGLLNPAADVGAIVRRHGRRYILDAMSSFGGVPMDQHEVGAHYLVSSANKCIQGVPGFGFVVAERASLEATRGQARSLSLDLYDQWRVLEEQAGKWRYTSPTHTVRAFRQALSELHDEGGVEARATRYATNHRTLVDGMRRLGFETLVPDALQSPIITTFRWPEHPDFSFRRLYDALKTRGFVIYPGKVSRADTFRVGTIGHVFPADVERLLEAVAASMYWA